MNSKKITFPVLFAFLATLTLSGSTASAIQVFGADVSVWESPPAVVVDVANGIYPIGGSGQIGGEFAVDTFVDVDAAIQIGIRAQERFVGPTLPRVDGMYFADVGESAPGIATWNYDFHLDFGTSYLEAQLAEDLTPRNMRDFIVVFELDTDPSFATSFVATDLNAAATAGGVGSGDPIVLLQSSQNIGFGVFGGPLDPNVPGVYDFRLTVIDPTNDKELAQVSMQVKVGEIPPIGGSILPIDSAALLLAGTQTSALWILPVVLSGIGVAVFILRRK